MRAWSFLLFVFGTAHASLIGGFEITFSGSGQHLNPQELEQALINELDWQKIYPMIRDPKTNALFWIDADHECIEIMTPPLRVDQVRQVLKPLFDVAENNNLTTLKGGGHIHLDLQQFESNPQAFLNFLITLHNESLASLLFWPMGPNMTGFHATRPTQIALLATFEILKQRGDRLTIREIQVALSYFYNRRGPFNFTPHTLEIRTIVNHSTAEGAEQVLRFYDALYNWAAAQSQVVPKRWLAYEFEESIYPGRGLGANYIGLMQKIGLDPQEYKLYVKALSLEQSREEPPRGKKYFQKMLEDSKLNEPILSTLLQNVDPSNPKLHTKVKSFFKKYEGYAVVPLVLRQLGSEWFEQSKFLAAFSAFEEELRDDPFSVPYLILKEPHAVLKREVHDPVTKNYWKFQNTGTHPHFPPAYIGYIQTRLGEMQNVSCQTHLAVLDRGLTLD